MGTSPSRSGGTRPRCPATRSSSSSRPGRAGPRTRGRSRSGTAAPTSATARSCGGGRSAGRTCSTAWTTCCPAPTPPACAPTTCRSPPPAHRRAPAPPPPPPLRAHPLPLSTRRPPAGRGPLLLAGDALSLVNPFTGEGIFYAVLSGSLAGAAAAEPDPARRYAAALGRRLGRHLRHSGATAWLSRAPRFVDAVVRAAYRDAAVFGRVVDLGLGDGTLDPRTLGRVARELVTNP